MIKSHDLLNDWQTVLQQSPFPCVMVDQNGMILWAHQTVLAWGNPFGQVGEPLVFRSDWSKILEQILNGQRFFERFETDGFLFHPTKLDTTHYLVWLIPTETPDWDFKQLQQNWAHKRKLANLGKMMSEIIHELNNPIAGLSMGIQMIELAQKKATQLIDKSAEPEKILLVLSGIRQELTKMQDSLKRASDLRQDILNYGKPSQLKLHPYVAATLMHQFKKTFEKRPQFKHITWVEEYTDTETSILGDAVKLEQIIDNLTKNACEAMHGNGEIRYRVFRESGAGLCIEVADSGPGVPEDLLDQIFSPFQSTKALSGTGLGLSITKEIIEQHGGTISVYNQEQSGACFKINFSQA